MWFRKKSSRRQAIREDAAESTDQRGWWRGGKGYMLLVAGVFFLVACALQFWPGDPLPFREGDPAPTDLRALADFNKTDPVQMELRREAVKAISPPVLVLDDATLKIVQSQLAQLRSLESAKNRAGVQKTILERFPGLTDQAVAWLGDPQNIRDFDSSLSSYLSYKFPTMPLVSSEDRLEIEAKGTSNVSLAGGSISGPVEKSRVQVIDHGGVSAAAREEARKDVESVFSPYLWDPITNYVMSLNQPTYHYSAKLTAAAAEDAANRVQPFGPLVSAGTIIVKQGELITPDKYQALLQAQEAYEQQVSRDHPSAAWLSRLGRALIVLILTVAGTAYIARLSDTRVSLRRAWAVCGLLLLMLIIAKFVVSWLPQTTYLMGLSPTLLTAIILVIAYNQRFSLGVSAIHGLLVTLTLGQNIDFFLTMLAGVTTFSFGLSEIRTRGKLIEVGFVASVVIFATVWALGLARMMGHIWSPSVSIVDTHWVQVQSLWAVCAGVIVAMFALAVLPSIERIFRITTAMTLLELCDANKPLLRRLSQEAPGTFNHSLTVGIMAEAAGNAIGANGLLCRVGAYYHDVGKLSKPLYFIENQAVGHPNRHDKLSPAMSLLIIVGHVKDGIELAREYALPWVIHQFIAQHHGTTLVEYFFHAARKRAEQEEARGGNGNAPVVSETEFRYPGPRPQTREAAIVMICDSCESIVRSIEGPMPGRIEAAVHNMIMKRLLDGQFNECDLTLRELSVIEETLVRTLAGIYHGRVPYPSAREIELPEPAVGLSQPA